MAGLITLISTFFLDMFIARYIYQQECEQKQLTDALKNNKDEFTFDAQCSTCNKKVTTLSALNPFKSACSCNIAKMQPTRNILNSAIILICISPLLSTLNFGYIITVLGLLITTYSISLVDLKQKLIPTYSCLIMTIFLVMTGDYIYINYTVFCLLLLCSLLAAFIFSFTESSNSKIGNGDIVFISIVGSYLLSIGDSKYLFPLYLLIVSFYSILSNMGTKKDSFALGPALHFGLVVCVGLYNFEVFK